jgi:hypothetical protein
MKHFLYALLLVSSFSAFSQTKVEKSKKELTTNEGRSSSSSSQHSSSGNSLRTPASEERTNLFLQITGYVMFGVFKYGVIGDYKNESHLDNNLSDYPFYDNEAGNYKTIDTNSLKKSYRLDIENKFLFSNKDLYGNHLNVKIRPFRYFYLQTDYHQLFEKNQMTTSTDRLSLFYFNLGYDRIRFENFNLGWTIGASYVGNEVKKAGFSVGVTTEAFFGKNISLLASAKWSSINGQPVNLYELEGKYHIKKGFVTLGFEHLRIASPTYNFISLGGGIYLN